MKIAVALSGGVDSSATAMLLHDQGHEVVAITFDLGDHGKEAVIDAKKVTDFLGIQHVVADYRTLFEEEVVTPFIQNYLQGKTPNPCVVCNKKIKFGRFIDDAVALGCDMVATGHYARVCREGDKAYIARSSDLKKDQSYALHLLTQEQIARVMLPLDGYTKEQLREMGRQRGLPVANRPDSQDICFIPTGSHGAFIEQHCESLPQVGNFIDVEGKVLGKHKGIYQYTIGQRKGLGISLGQYAYVDCIDPKTGDITLTVIEEDLFSHTVWMEAPKGSDCQRIFTTENLTAKLRYAHKAAAVEKLEWDGDILGVTFTEKQRAATPGQSLVFYDGDLVLGGGEIVKGK